MGHSFKNGFATSVMTQGERRTTSIIIITVLFLLNIHSSRWHFILYKNLKCFQMEWNVVRVRGNMKRSFYYFIQDTNLP